MCGWVFVLVVVYVHMWVWGQWSGHLKFASHINFHYFISQFYVSLKYTHTHTHTHAQMKSLRLLLLLLFLFFLLNCLWLRPRWFLIPSLLCLLFHWPVLYFSAFSDFRGIYIYTLLHTHTPSIAGKTHSHSHWHIQLSYKLTFTLHLRFFDRSTWKSTIMGEFRRFG